MNKTFLKFSLRFISVIDVLTVEKFTLTCWNKQGNQTSKTTFWKSEIDKMPKTPKTLKKDGVLADVVFSEERADVCKQFEYWKKCESWKNNCRCLKDCDFHLQT
jgi:hypothetical protein